MRLAKQSEGEGRNHLHRPVRGRLGRESQNCRPRFGRRAVMISLLYIMYKRLFSRDHNKQ